MADLIARISAWRLAIFKCAMLVFISMGTLLVAASQNWTDEYVSTLRWYNWASLVIAALVNGCTTINSFIDKTFQTEGMKVAFDEQVRAEQGKADVKIAEIKQDVVDAKLDAVDALGVVKSEKDNPV